MPRQQVIDFKYARPEVDVWATAASLYYMLTLQYPRDFPEGADPWQVVLQTDAVPVRRRNASIPPKLAQAIDRALVDQPDIAIKTAEELTAVLGRTPVGNSVPPAEPLCRLKYPRGGRIP